MTTPTPKSQDTAELDEILHELICQPMTEARNMGYEAGKTGQDDTGLLPLLDETEEKAKAVIRTLLTKSQIAALEEVKANKVYLRSGSDRAVVRVSVIDTTITELKGKL